MIHYIASWLEICEDAVENMCEFHGKDIWFPCKRYGKRVEKAWRYNGKYFQKILEMILHLVARSDTMLSNCKVSYEGYMLGGTYMRYGHYP